MPVLVNLTDQPIGFTGSTGLRWLSELALAPLSRVH